MQGGKGDVGNIEVTYRSAGRRKDGDVIKWLLFDGPNFCLTQAFIVNIFIIKVHLGRGPLTDKNYGEENDTSKKYWTGCINTAD